MKKVIYIWDKVLGWLFKTLSHNRENGILLKEYQPHSQFVVQKSLTDKAKFEALDMHAHDSAQTPEALECWIKTMDDCNIQKIAIMHYLTFGRPFEDFVEAYKPYKERFTFWCSFDYTDIDTAEGLQKSLAYLEHCKELGAVGVGEMGDKGDGDLYARPLEGRGIHLDDPRIQPLLQKCGELKMPISVHIADAIWMYQPIDEHNEGLMTAANWHIEAKEGRYDYEQLIASFENAVSQNPHTIFIACHCLNMTHDLQRLGIILDKYPNLYVDISARIGELAAIPRAAREFIIRYQDRILFGTDSGNDKQMYQNYFRILETADEHFYLPELGYKWYYNGLYLPDEVLKKIYWDNAMQLLIEYK